MRSTRILAALVLAALAAPAVPTVAQLQSPSCGRCLSTYPCTDDLQACFLDCQGRFLDPNATDRAGFIDSCNTDCNRKFSICNQISQESCLQQRACP